MRIAFFGECMIELSGSPLQRGFGGDTLNTALYLARLASGQQLQVSYATSMGNDKLSESIINQWTDAGIDNSLVSLSENKMPGLYMVETDSHGDRSFYYWRSDSAVKDYFKHADNPLSLQLSELDYIYLSGVSLAILSSADRQTLFALLSQFKAQGGLVIFDNNFRPQLWSKQTAAKIYVQMLALTDIALLTEDDERAVFDDQNYQQILQRCQQFSIKEVVIKRGLKPCIVSCENYVHEVAAVKVNKVIDTTAAGDSFAAGYLYKRLLGSTALQAAEAGHQLAGTVIQHSGAIIDRSFMPEL